MLDDVDARPEQADTREHVVRPARELAQHARRGLLVGGLAVHAPVEVHRRVDPEGEPALMMGGSGLATRVVADEHDRIGIGGVVLDVRWDDNLERDPELLEDRPALRRRRREREHALRTWSAMATEVTRSSDV